MSYSAEEEVPVLEVAATPKRLAISEATSNVTHHASDAQTTATA